MRRSPEVCPLVLLVEDDFDTREMYVVALGLLGFRTAEAGTAAEARALAQSLLPDVVVTDLTLPDADGCDLCAALASDATTHRIPTIALTGRSSDEDFDRCAAAGCVRVLVKPCAPDALAKAIDDVLSEAKTRQG